MPAKVKQKSFELRRNSLNKFLSVACAPHVYVRASTLCYFQPYWYPHPHADSIGGQMRRDKECPFSVVTNYGRDWKTGAGKRGCWSVCALGSYLSPVFFSSTAKGTCVALGVFFFFFFVCVWVCVLFCRGSS